MAQTKKVSFAGCQILNSQQAWCTNSRTGKHYLRKGVIGRVSARTNSIIASTNRSGQNPQFLRSSSCLNNRQKTEILRVLDTENRDVAYIYDPTQDVQNIMAARSGSAASGASASGTGKSKPSKGGRF